MPEDQQGQNDTIPHEDAVRAVVADELGDADGTLLGDPEGAIANAATNASTTHALNSTFSDTEAEAALNALGTFANALGTKINLILVALRNKNIIDT